MPKPISYWEDILDGANRHREALLKSYFKPYAPIEPKPSVWRKDADGRWRRRSQFGKTYLNWEVLGWVQRNRTKRWLLRTLRKLDHRIKHCEERIAARKTVWDLVHKGGLEAAKERAKSV